MSDEKYDSAADTKAHIKEVERALYRFIGSLVGRAILHDASKLESPEKEAFDLYTPRLRGLTYGSDEYRRCLEEMKPALAHHYANNRHHPEHHRDGVRGMNLVDVVEMFCDWSAAVKRHADGDLRRSIEINQARFGYSDDLKQILLNTVDMLEGL